MSAAGVIEARVQELVRVALSEALGAVDATLQALDARVQELEAALEAKGPDPAPARKRAARTAAAGTAAAAGSTEH